MPDETISEWTQRPDEAHIITFRDYFSSILAQGKSKLKCSECQVLKKNLGDEHLIKTQNLKRINFESFTAEHCCKGSDTGIDIV